MMIDMGEFSLLLSILSLCYRRSRSLKNDLGPNPPNGPHLGYTASRRETDLCSRCCWYRSTGSHVVSGLSGSTNIDKNEHLKEENTTVDKHIGKEMK